MAAALVLASAALAPPRAVAQVAPVIDSNFVKRMGQMARQRAVQLATPPAQPENPRAVQQYRDALADMERGAFGDAATKLQAVLLRAPLNAMYHGDLAYAYLRLGQWEPASTEYTRAYQAQQQNGWYVLGIATTKAAQRPFADAAGAADLAAQTDSSVVDGVLASVTAGWFEAAGDRTRALAWARIAVQKSPDNAIDYLRIASYLMTRNDTTPEGIAAVRRYLALRPGDKLGSAVYANYLYVAGNSDSAMTLAEFAAADSAYRAFAAQVFLSAGRSLLLRRDVDRTIQVLTKGQTWADSTQRPGFANILGRAQLLRLSALFTTYEDGHSCEVAHTLDTLMAATERNLRAGIPFDSLRTQSLIENVLPQYKANAQSAVQTCGAARPTNRPPQRPAPRPRRP